MADSKFLYGTAGWSYKDWDGPFYPSGTSESDFLSLYAERFPAVEVDSTYYRIPSRRMVENWARKTPDDFLFSPKMVGKVTHDRFLKDCDDLVKEYLSALSPLGRKLGPIVLQFPYFRKAESVSLDVFLDRLCPFIDALPDNLRFAVETRNKAFLKPELFEALIRKNMALVLNDHPYMPRPEEFIKIDGVLTADFVPIRLLGDRRGIEKITKTWGKVVVDKEKRLQGWATVIQHALKSGMGVQAFANNHFAGHGPATITELVRIIREQRQNGSLSSEKPHGC